MIKALCTKLIFFYDESSITYLLKFQNLISNLKNESNVKILQDNTSEKTLNLTKSQLCNIIKI